MSDVCVYIELEDYISQWFIHEQGGCTPVRLTRGSVESKLLEVFLKALPDDEVPDIDKSGKLAIAIPIFKNRPPESCNYLPKHAVRALQNIIRHRFDVLLWSELHRFGKITKEQKEIIYAWMEKHGIDDEEKNWGVIVKRYQRQRDVYYKRGWSKVQYAAKKNVEKRVAKK